MPIPRRPGIDTNRVAAATAPMSYLGLPLGCRGAAAHGESLNLDAGPGSGLTQ